MPSDDHRHQHASAKHLQNQSANTADGMACFTRTELERVSARYPTDWLTAGRPALTSYSRTAETNYVTQGHRENASCASFIFPNMSKRNGLGKRQIHTELDAVMRCWERSLLKALVLESLTFLGLRLGLCFDYWSRPAAFKKNSVFPTNSSRPCQNQ